MTPLSQTLLSQTPPSQTPPSQTPHVSFTPWSQNVNCTVRIENFESLWLLLKEQSTMGE